MDMNNPEVIKFKFANKDHKDLMVNQILPSSTGISHEVFNEEVTNANQENCEKENVDVLKDFKYVYVPEVVREPKMHYW